MSYTTNQLLSDVLNNTSCFYDAYLDLENSPESLSSKIHVLCAKFGIHLLNLNPSQSILWDGHYLRIKNVTVANILHEIAHFQVAKPYHRYQLDFGLGQGPESKIILHEKKILNKIAGIQEEYASVLGILWCKKLNIKAGKVFAAHSWADRECDRSLFRSHVIKLKNLRLISDCYEPLECTTI